MSDGLTLREKGIQLNHILSGLDDAETCLCLTSAPLGQIEVFA